MARKITLKRRISRRETLGLLGGAAVAAIVGCGDDEPSATPEASATRTASRTAAASTADAAATVTATAEPVACVLTLQETEGPYFVDEMLNRSDIRSDPTTGVVKEGIPLALTLTVSEVDGANCTPLASATVDMWHCDALGVYSDVSAGAGQADTTGQKFLRGYQVTDASGRVQFQTIYPGWYSGRTIHIHFKVRTEQNFEFTSQFFFDEALNDAVIAQSPYNEKGTPDTRNASDNIFDSSLIVPLTPQGGGYSGLFHVGVDFA